MHDSSNPSGDATASALVPVRRSPSKMVVARSLDDASERSFVHVDRHGRVRSPTRFRVLQGLGYAGLATIPALPILYGVAYGPLGAAVALGLSGWAFLRMRPAFALQKAARLLQDDRLGEARALLEKIAESRGATRQTRGLAHYNLSVYYNRLGELDLALREIRTSRSLLDGALASGVYRRMAPYAEINVLVSLGQREDARKVLAGVGGMPDGEYLRTLYWIAQLHIAFAAGPDSPELAAIDDDDLHERSKKGLAMTSGSALLALCAWAWRTRGDADFADHLLGEAFDRLATDRLEKTMPTLWQWMDEHRPVERDPYDAL